jgi:adenylate cyclase
VRNQVRDKLPFSFEDLGEQAVKNIARPLRVFRVSWGAPGASSGRTGAEPARPALSLPDKPSIAVLPFTNMSGDPEQEYFSDGVVEEITAALSCLKSFFVIARNSSFTYKGRSVDVKQVGRELGVRYVHEGSVRKAANRVRITGQLIDARTGNHLWGGCFYRTTALRCREHSHHNQAAREPGCLGLRHPCALAYRPLQQGGQRRGKTPSQAGN